MLKLHQVMHARALATHGNFGRAADSLNMSQPALSRSISSLEKKMGVLLFDRQSGRVKPTVFGQTLLDRGKTILIEAEELERQIEILKKIDTGQFSVSLGPSPAGLSGSRALAELVRLHPNLSCKANVRLWHLVLAEVIKRRVDLGICELNVIDRSDTRLSVEALPEHGVVMYCRKSHPLLEKRKLSKADLNRYPLAMPIAPPRVAEELPGKSSIDKDTGYLLPSIEVDDLEMACRVVEGSNAISWNTPLQLEPWLEKGTIEALPYRRPWMKLMYGFVFLRQRMLSPATELYMQLVRDIEKDLASRNQALMKQLF
jgi:DNA-binding transcriptional LysR family regulator